MRAVVAGIVLLVMSTFSSTAVAQDQTLTQDAVMIRGAIDEKVADGFTAFLQEQELAGATRVFIFIDSLGGDFHPGMRIADEIKKSRLVSICVANKAASIAFSVLQACDWRGAVPTALLHTHRPYIELEKGATLEIPELEETLTLLKDEAQEMSFGIAKASCWEQGAVDKRMTKGDWRMSAQKALDLNFIDEIVTVEK